VACRFSRAGQQGGGHGVGMEDCADVCSTIEHQVQEGFRGWSELTPIGWMSLTINS
jgi:hypothetical protein